MASPTLREIKNHHQNMKNLTEQELNYEWEHLQLPFKRLTIEVFKELLHAVEKHPDFVIGIVDQVAVVSEEAGEAIQAALQFKYENGSAGAVRKELIQTAASCIRCLLHLPEDKPAIQRWIKEADTQVLPLNPEPKTGQYCCTTEFTNDYGYTYKEGSTLTAIRFAHAYDSMVCRINEDDPEFFMDVETLLNHFIPSEMVGGV